MSSEIKFNEGEFTLLSYFEEFKQVNEQVLYLNQNDPCVKVERGAAGTYSSSQHWESSQHTEWVPGSQLAPLHPPPASAPLPAMLQANQHIQVDAEFT